MEALGEQRFVGGSDAGSVALIVVGAFFLFMAITDRPLTSARVGDNEVRFARRVVRNLGRAFETGSLEAKEEIAEAIVEAVTTDRKPDEDYSSRPGDAVLAFDFEQSVIEALRRVMSDKEVRVLSGFVEPDAIVRDATTAQTLLVGARFRPRRPLLRREAERLACRMSSLAEELRDVSGGIVVSNATTLPRAELRCQDIDSMVPVRVVLWRDERDDLTTWGKRYRLKIVERPGRAHVEVDGDRLLMYFSEGTDTAARTKLLQDWQRKQLRVATKEFISFHTILTYSSDVARNLVE